jgi:VIT1/CCC1 family predicted Fe2+/Mn2+ transporter
MHKRLKIVDKHINITDEQQKKILQNLENNEKRKRTKTEVAIKISFSLFVIISIPLSTKAVIDLVNTRFQNIEKEQVSSMVNSIDSSPAQEFTFSRPYSSAEEKRLERLTKQYIKGTYPSDEILLSTVIYKDKLFFSVEENQYYLPDRTMTDEELLQIIEHQFKSDYVVNRRYQEKSLYTKIDKESYSSEKNRVTRQSVIKISNEWLFDILGEDSDGMEIKCEYITTNEQDSGLDGLTLPIYIVSYSVKSSSYYYFYISPEDGKLQEFTLTNNSIRNNSKINTYLSDDVVGKINKLYEFSSGFLNSKLKLKEEFSKITCEYFVNENEVLGSSIYFIFIKKDGSFYEIGIKKNTEKIFSFTSRSDYNAYRIHRREEFGNNVEIIEKVIYNK